MNDVAPGGGGEIVYRGPTMMLEYWQNPAATADAFPADGSTPEIWFEWTTRFVYVVAAKGHDHLRW